VSQTNFADNSAFAELSATQRGHPNGLIEWTYERQGPWRGGMNVNFSLRKKRGFEIGMRYLESIGQAREQVITSVIHRCE
jgi:hypothetical protein